MYLKRRDLHDVIKSLSFAEKKFVSEYLKELNRDKDYLYFKLFQAIQQNKSEFSILTLEASPQALTIAKKRLYQHIMLCLRNFHQKKSTQIVIQNILCEVEILYDLGLGNQCIILLKKAYTKAVAHEKYGLLLQILEWERKLKMVLDTPNRSIDEIATEESSVLKNFQQIIELERVLAKMKEMKKQYGYARGAVKNILEQTMAENSGLINVQHIYSQRGKYYYHFIHVLYYRMTFNHKLAYQHSKQLLNSSVQNILPNEYLEGALEHITSCVSLGSFKEALKCMKTVSHFILEHKFDQSNAFQVRMFYHEICYKLIIYNYMGWTLELRKTIHEAEEKMKIYEKQLSIEMKLVIYGNLRNAYVGIGEFEKAENAMDLLLQKQSKSVRNDVYNNVYLFRIFALLYSATYILIPTVALSAQRYYRQNKGDETHLEVELKIISLLLRKRDLNNERIRRNVLLKIHDILLQHIESLKGLHHFQDYYSFYIIWIESMLQKEGFHIAASKWYKQFEILSLD